VEGRVGFLLRRKEPFLKELIFEGGQTTHILPDITEEGEVVTSLTVPEGDGRVK